MERVDCVVIGAGVVGLAVARRLALAGREVIVLERTEAIGTETSSRNSEVIHAGIYYPPGSLKSRACIEGKRFLYRFCAERGIAHDACGKLIVATSEDQIATLRGIQARAAAAGMPDLELWPAERARELEPELACTAALWSPTSGIVDSHGLMLAFQGDAEDRGAMIAFGAEVEALRVGDRAIELHVGGAEPMRLEAEIVVNSAGLDAPGLAARTSGLPDQAAPRGFYCKGSYYQLAGRSPFRRLIYPVPEAAGLGVHATVDLAGQCRFGPDTEWVETLGYDVDPGRAQSFYAEVRKYWPALADGALVPGYAGIRPKLGPAGTQALDFAVHGAETHGIRGLVNLFGIESPGLTACWPLAMEVAARLDLPPLGAPT